MKRPLIWFTAAFTLAVLCELRISPRPPHMLLWLLPVLAATAAAFWFSKTRFLGVLLLGGLSGILLAAGYTAWVVDPLAALAGSSASVEATVADYPQIYDDEQRVTLRIAPKALGLSGPRPAARVPVYLPLTGHPLEPGDRVDATLAFYRPTVSDGFARREYYAGNGVFVLAANAEDDSGAALPVMVSPPARVPLATLPLRAAHALKMRVVAALPAREAGLTVAVMLGDKSGLAEEDALALRRAGLSHIAAVSGMHVGFLVGFCFLLFGRKWGTALSALAILFFIPMAGASPSVVRAGVMYLAGAAGFYLSREKDGLNTLCLALLILLGVSPYALYSMSLQLSFAATLGLLLFAGRMQYALLRPFAGWPRPARQIGAWIAGSLSCSLAAMAFTTPLLLSSFGYVSALSLLANLGAVPLVGLLFVGGHLCGLLLLLFPGAAPLCGALLRPIAAASLFVATRVAALPYGLVFWEDRFGRLAIAAIYLALALLLLPKPKIRLRYVAPVLSAVLVLCTVCGIRDSRRTLRVSFLPSGAGQTAAVSYGGRSLTLIDCAASGYRDACANVKEYLAWHGLQRVDTLVLTAVDKTHARSVPDLLAAVPVGRIVIPPRIRESEMLEQLFEAAARRGVPIETWEQAGEHPLPGSPADSLSLIGGVDRKLAVRIRAPETDMLILHSFTQNMLAELLAAQPLTARTVVLSEGNVSDPDKLAAALTQLAPQEIVLQSGYSDTDALLGRWPARNTQTEGEIDYRVRIPLSED